MKNRIESEEVLTKLFGSISRARILGFLYAHTGQSFYQREIMYETGLSLRPVQRELDNLVDLAFLRDERHTIEFFDGGLGVVSTLLTGRSELDKGQGVRSTLFKRVNWPQ